ncbi:MAG TPA: TRAP transporter large permease subunit [Geminicoccaceae bacterium]|nr:TRAP transporter large permease subunit [Geminicoccaceae bacterium]
MAEGYGLAALMFPALFGLLLLGIPVAFALIVVSFAFGALFFGDAIGLQLYGRVLDVTSGFALAAVPLFILMGAVLEKSGIALRLFAAMRLWLGRLPGGLALATMAMAGVFAAASGIVGAVEVVIGLMALPAMLRHGYDRGLACGTVCAGGSLGTIIPPSILCVIYGTVGQISIADLFAGCMVPGLLMLLLFGLYILLRCALRPGDGPPAAAADGGPPPLLVRLRVTAVAVLPASALIVLVLGSIVLGVASPTEAAAVGAAGALALTLAEGRLSRPLVVEALRRTVLITAMILLIVLGGTMFSSVFYVHGGGRMVQALVGAFELGPGGMMALFLAIVFAAGFVLDWATVVLVCVPIFTPLLQAQGVDPLWFAVLMIIVLQTSYLTPPMAPSIFYLRGIAPPEIGHRDMYRGVAPFIACQLLTLLVVFMLPEAATWLPGALRRY